MRSKIQVRVMEILLLKYYNDTNGSQQYHCIILHFNETNYDLLQLQYVSTLLTFCREIQKIILKIILFCLHAF